MEIVRQLSVWACLMVSTLVFAQTLTIEQYIEVEHAALSLSVQRMQITLNAIQNGQVEDDGLQSVEALYQGYGVTVRDVLRFQKYHQKKIDVWYEQHPDDLEERDNLLSVMDTLSVQIEALVNSVQP